MQREGSWMVRAAVTGECYADGVTPHLAHHGAASRRAETLQGVSPGRANGVGIWIPSYCTLEPDSSRCWCRALSCIPFSFEQTPFLFRSVLKIVVIPKLGFGSVSRLCHLGRWNTVFFKLQNGSQWLWIWLTVPILGPIILRHLFTVCTPQRRAWGIFPRSAFNKGVVSQPQSSWKPSGFFRAILSCCFISTWWLRPA